ncbi:MAG: nickel pincer cofactor biosynthesis protein LarC [Syntrophomonadaceae bacterium]
MSKVLYFDCFAGISGDMTLGALLDLGVDKDYLSAELARLNLGEFNLKISRKTRQGIAGTDVQVSWPGAALQQHPKPLHFHTHLHTHKHGHKHDGHEYAHEHEHEHDHEHNHEHSYENNHEHTPTPAIPDAHHHSHHHVQRNLEAIEALIKASSLSDRVQAVSIGIFSRLAQAEAQVHGKSMAEVHFHEVGAVDSIVDIVGTAICLDYLGIEKVIASPLHLGCGFLQCAHGTLPVESPATMTLLSGVPVYSSGLKHELVTPTGAAIITTLAEAFIPMPEMVINAVGYGVGDREIEIPNLLRVILAEENSTALLMLESNIDDMNPEYYSHLFPLLLEQGALDVYLTPIIMKKNRPGVILSVLCPASLANRLEETIFLETTTLGIRRVPVNRNSLPREVRQVNTSLGPAAVKVVWRNGAIFRIAPEFEDCQRIAREKHLPLQEVYRQVSRDAQILLQG